MRKPTNEQKGEHRTPPGDVATRRLRAPRKEGAARLEWSPQPSGNSNCHSSGRMVVAEQCRQFQITSSNLQGERANDQHELVQLTDSSDLLHRLRGNPNRRRLIVEIDKPFNRTPIRPAIWVRADGVFHSVPPFSLLGRSSKTAKIAR